MKISETTDYTAAQGTDELLLRRGAGNGRATVAEFIKSAPGNVYVIGQSYVAATKSDANTTETTLATIVIPGGTLGANDALRITAKWRAHQGSQNKVFRCKFDNNTAQGYSTTAQGTLQQCVIIANRNATNAQLAALQSTADQFGWSTTTAYTTLTVDTTVDKNVTLTAQWGSAGAGTNVITLEGYTVEVLRAP